VKVWSRILDRNDLDRAAYRVNADFPGCDVYVAESAELYEGPRTRRWDRVSLCSRTSTRYRNPGGTQSDRFTFYTNANAASWTEWGWWLARLFDIDEDARCNDYRGRTDFHAATNGRFLEPRNARELQVARVMFQTRENKVRI
jgi:hypothetical protein